MLGSPMAWCCLLLSVTCIDPGTIDARELNVAMRYVYRCFNLDLPFS